MHTISVDVGCVFGDLNWQFCKNVVLTAIPSNRISFIATVVKMNLCRYDGWVLKIVNKGYTIRVENRNKFFVSQSI